MGSGDTSSVQERPKVTSGQRVARAAGFIMVAMMISRVLGYVREIVLTSKFGISGMTDAYNVSFAIPDLLYNLLVGGALSSAFIPVFSSYIARGEEEEGWKVASTFINIVVVVLGMASIISMIFTPQIMPLVAHGYKGETLDMAVKLTRVILPTILFTGLNGIFMGLLNSYQHFKAPAIGSILYNVGIIAMGVLLANVLDPPIMGFSVGVIVGMTSSVLIQLPAVYKRGARYRFNFEIFHPGVKKIFILMIPAIVALGVSQINLLINLNLASTLQGGSITALRLASRLMQLPLGVFGVAVAIAILPTLTAQATRHEMADYRKTLSMGVRSVFFVTIPAGVGLMVLGVPIIRLLFQQGKVTPEDVTLTAGALFFYALGLFGHSAVLVLVRGFYALQDTLTPVLVGFTTIAVNFGSNLLLLDVMQEKGLALAFSLTGIFNMLVLFYLLRRKVGPIDFRRISKSFGLIALASVALGAVAYGTSSFLGNIVDVSHKSGQLVQVGGAIVAGIAVFVVATILFKMEEANMVWGIIKRKFVRRQTA